jgi:hypothetical protein
VFVQYVDDFAVLNGPECRVEAVRVPKCRKAVMCLTEKTPVLGVFVPA